MFYWESCGAASNDCSGCPAETVVILFFSTGSATTPVGGRSPYCQLPWRSFQRYHWFSSASSTQPPLSPPASIWIPVCSIVALTRSGLSNGLPSFTGTNISAASTAITSAITSRKYFIGISPNELSGPQHTGGRSACHDNHGANVTDKQNTGSTSGAPHPMLYSEEVCVVSRHQHPIRGSLGGLSCRQGKRDMQNNEGISTGDEGMMSPARVIDDPARQRFVVLVGSAKVGCGKTKLSTNLAASYARQGQAVSLLDMDPQQAAHLWLTQRQKKGTHHEIHGQAMAISRDFNAGRLHSVIRDSRDYLVIDSPAGLEGPALDALLRTAQVVLVPVLPSPIDIRAARSE